MPRILFIAIASLLAVPAAQAQSDWRSVNQSASWVNTFLEQPTGERASLWFDGHWRRMGVGTEPQQLLLRPGVLWRLSPTMQLGAGYAYIATAPYGELAGPASGREQRSWQQLVIATSVSAWSVSHRLRWEQRWLSSVVGGTQSASRYQQRARYFVRAQRPLGDSDAGRRALLGFVYNEFFLPVGHSDGRDARVQNRLGGGIGVPVGETARVEFGYMHQWNRVTPQEAHEFNHTLVLSWVWSGRR